MASLSVEVHVAGSVSLPVPPERVEGAVLHVLRAEALAEAEISIALVGDSEIIRLNHEFLQHEGPTDVISFPLQLPGGPQVGDIYIGVEQARRQAAEMGVPLDEELLRLAVHGTLHVLGYDHPEADHREHSAMYRRQEELLAAVLDPGIAKR